MTLADTLHRTSEIVVEYVVANDLDTRYTEHSGVIGVLTHCFASVAELHAFNAYAETTLAPLDLSTFFFVDANVLATKAKIVALMGATMLDRRAIVALSVMDAGVLSTCYDWQRAADETTQPIVVDRSPATPVRVLEQSIGVNARPPAAVCVFLAAHVQRALVAATSELLVYFVKYSVDTTSGDVAVEACEGVALATARLALPANTTLDEVLAEMADGADSQSVVVVSAREVNDVYAPATWHVSRSAPRSDRRSGDVKS